MAKRKGNASVSVLAPGHQDAFSHSAASVNSVHLSQHQYAVHDTSSIEWKKKSELQVQGIYFKPTGHFELTEIFYSTLTNP